MIVGQAAATSVENSGRLITVICDSLNQTTRSRPLSKGHLGRRTAQREPAGITTATATAREDSVEDFDCQTLSIPIASVVSRR